MSLGAGLRVGGVGGGLGVSLGDGLGVGPTGRRDGRCVMSRDGHEARDAGKVPSRAGKGTPGRLGKGVHALLTEEHGDGDEGVDGNQIAGLDADHEEHHELHVGVEDADGDQEAEDAAEAAIERSLRAPEAQARPAGVEDSGRNRRPKNRGGIEAHDPARAVKALEESRKEPKGEQLEEGADQQGSWVDQAEGEGLPQGAVKKGAGNKDQAARERFGHSRKDQPQERQGKVGKEVPEHQASGCAVEFRESELCRADPGHGQSQVKPFAGRCHCAGCA